MSLPRDITARLQQARRQQPGTGGTRDSSAACEEPGRLCPGSSERPFRFHFYVLYIYIFLVPLLKANLTASEVNTSAIQGCFLPLQKPHVTHVGSSAVTS